ncbi:MAG: hypothetical protein RR332_04625, partial [Clostridiales bacterium]
RILISADPTVNIAQSSPQAMAAAFAEEGIPVDQPKICFCLRNWPNFDHPEYIAMAADYAYEKYGLVPVFLPF